MKPRYDRHNAVEIQFDLSGIEEAKKALSHIKGGIEAALKQALNKANAGIKTDAAKGVPKVYNAVTKESVKKKYGLPMPQQTIQTRSNSI